MRSKTQLYPTQLLIFAVLLWVASLVFPVGIAGKFLTGFECLAVLFLFSIAAFLSATAWDSLAIFGLLAFFANLFLVAFAWLCIGKVALGTAFVKYLSCLLLLLTVMIMLASKGHLNQIYTAFVLWILSLLLTGLAGLLLANDSKHKL